MIVGLFFLIAIVALFALAFAFVLSVVSAGTSWRRRVAIAALGSGFVTTLPAFFAVGFGLEGSAGSFIPLASIFVLALFLSAIVGFPAAYFFTRRIEAKRNPPVEPGVFE